MIEWHMYLRRQQKAKKKRHDSMLCQSLKGFLTAIFAAQVSQIESEVLGKSKVIKYNAI